jgi:hypothetical protein
LNPPPYIPTTTPMMKDIVINPGKKSKLRLKKLKMFDSCIRQIVDNVAKKCHDLKCEKLLESREIDYIDIIPNEKSTTTADEDDGKNDYKEMTNGLIHTFRYITNLAFMSLFKYDGTFFRLFLEDRLKIYFTKFLLCTQFKLIYKKHIYPFFLNICRRKPITSNYVPTKPLEVQISHDESLLDILAISRKRRRNYEFIKYIWPPKYDDVFFQVDVHNNKMNIMLPIDILRFKDEFYHVIKCIDDVYLNLFKKRENVLITNRMNIFLHLGLPAGWEKWERNFDGKIYYVDHKNEKNQWEDPSGGKSRNAKLMTYNTNFFIFCETPDCCSDPMRPERDQVFTIIYIHDLVSHRVNYFSNPLSLAPTNNLHDNVISNESVARYY